MSKKQDNHKIINEWVERNLTQETAAGPLSKAFEVDRIIDQLTDYILIFVMILSTSDPLKSAGRWIRKVANMELSWSRRLGLTASVAAYSIAEGELNRAVLEIEGPGAEFYLAMEIGKDGWTNFWKDGAG